MARGFLDEDRSRRGDEEVRKSDLVDIAAELVHQTSGAFLINDGSRQVWVPKTLVERDGNTFTMPARLAKEKRLI